MIEVIPTQSTVLVGDDIEATVIGICIRGSNVQYECAWWDGNTRVKSWFESFEVNPQTDAETQRIGFSG